MVGSRKLRDAIANDVPPGTFTAMCNSLTAAFIKHIPDILNPHVMKQYDDFMLRTVQKIWTFDLAEYVYLNSIQHAMHVRDSIEMWVAVVESVQRAILTQAAEQAVAAVPKPEQPRKQRKMAPKPEVDDVKPEVAAPLKRRGRPKRVVVDVVKAEPLPRKGGRPKKLVAAALTEFVGAAPAPVAVPGKRPRGISMDPLWDDAEDEIKAESPI